MHEAPPNNQDIVLSIQGMSCSACATRIEKTLEKMDGIEDFAVSYPMRTAWISCKSEHVLSQIIHKIERLGFTAKLFQSPIEDMRLEKRLLQRRLLWSSAFTFPLLLPMLQHFRWTNTIAESLPQWLFSPILHFVLATIVQFIIALPFYQNAYYAIREKVANMDVLVVIGTTASYFYSHYEMFKHGWDQMLSFSSLLSQHLYFETSGVVISAVLLGKYIELNATLRLQSENKAFSTLEPFTARVERNGELISLDPHYVQKGELVHIEAGESVPIDGIVAAGEAYAEESLLTGESGWIHKGVGERVWAGTRLMEGKLIALATESGYETFLAKIHALIKQGHRSKSNLQRQVDKVTRWFVPIVLFISLMTLIIPFLQGKPLPFTHALAVLLVACPCALGLAAPISISVASSKLIKHGFIVKDASVLERLARVTQLVFDKTGTITEGKMEVSFMQAFKANKQVIFPIINALEQPLKHPIALALKHYAGQNIQEQLEVKLWQNYIGMGVGGYIDRKHYLIGNERLFQQFNLQIEPYQLKLAEERAMQGETVLYMFEQGRLVAMFGLSDRIKSSSQRAMQHLEEMNIQVAMATGDHALSAKKAARQVGIKHIYSTLLPDQKLELINHFKRQNKVVAMVGDGVNDAPALASSHVGIAMSHSAKETLDAGHMTMLYNQLEAIPLAIKICRMTLSNIKQNLGFALTYNIFMLPFAMFGYLQPWMAGVAMALSSICVVFNSLYLHYKLRKLEKAVS